MSFINFLDSVSRAVQQLATQPAAPVHVVQRHETLPDIAAQHRGTVPQAVYEQSLKDANPQVLNWEALYPDTPLQLPPAHDGEADPVVHAAAPAQADKPALSPEAQRVDAALKADAQQSTPQTQAELKSAIQAEMKARFQVEFDARPTGAIYDTKAIASYGDNIAARHADDPAAQASIKATVKDISIDHEVEFALTVSGGGDAKSVMSILKSQWASMSPEAQARLATSPELGRLLNDKIEPYVAAPYANFSSDDPREQRGPANEAAKRLAELVDGLPPELANAVVTQNLDTVMRIVQVKPMYAGEKFGGSSYADMARVVGALGNGEDGKRMRADIASMYLANPEALRGQWVPFSENISNAIRDGASPALALEMAQQLKNQGLNEQAGVFLRGISHGAELLQGKIDADLKEYQSMMGELGRLLKYSEGLPPEAISQAVDKYLAGKGKSDPGWLEKFHGLEDRLTANANVLKDTLGGLNALPEDLKATYPDLGKEMQAVANNDSVLQAFGLAAARDRDFLIGAEADAATKLFDVTKVSKEGAEYLKRLANDGIQQAALKVFSDLDSSDPTSIANAKTQLESLSTRYASLLGKDSEQYREAIRALEGLTSVPAGDTAAMEAQLKQFNQALSGIDGFNANQPAGVTFRSLGVAAAGLAFAKSSSDLISDPGWANAIGAFADAAGLAKDVRDLMHRPGSIPIDADSALADSHARAGVRFENWNRALGLLSATGDIAKMADALLSDRPYKEAEAALYGLGATGTVVMTLTSGPVGAIVGAVMIGVSVFGQSALADTRDKDAKIKGSQEFLQNAGFDADAARIMGDLGEDEHYQSIPVVPLMMEYGKRDGLGTGKPMTPEETIKAINDMPPDQLQVMVNRLRIAAR